MTRERHERLMALFESSLDLTPPERARYLDEQCSDDPSLREEVEALLSADGPQGSLLDDSPIPAVSRFLREALTEPSDRSGGEAEAPAAVFHLSEATGKSEVIDPDACEFVGCCEAAEENCPVEAITLRQ